MHWFSVPLPLLQVIQKLKAGNSMQLCKIFWNDILDSKWLLHVTGVKINIEKRLAFNETASKQRRIIIITIYIFICLYGCAWQLCAGTISEYSYVIIITMSTVKAINFCTLPNNQQPTTEHAMIDNKLQIKWEENSSDGLWFNVADGITSI